MQNADAGIMTDERMQNISKYEPFRKKTQQIKMYAASLKGDADKLIIWMPTFRNRKGGCFKETQHLTQFPLMRNDEDWFELDRTCREKGIKIIVKLHQKQKEYPICWDKFSNIKELSVSDMESKGTMLYPLLTVTDALISDYSSVAVDYMIVNKPIAYCLDDYVLYKNARGFVVDDPRDYMIGHHLYKLDDLLGFVSDIAENKDVYAQKRTDIFDTLVYRSDCYCKELADYLQISK